MYNYKNYQFNNPKKNTIIDFETQDQPTGVTQNLHNTYMYWKFHDNHEISILDIQNLKKKQVHQRRLNLLNNFYLQELNTHRPTLRISAQIILYNKIDKIGYVTETTHLYELKA